MRVSAHSTAEFVGEQTVQDKAFQEFIAKINADTAYLPADEKGKSFDRILAQTCIDLALQRHAGTQKRVFTAMGDAFIQQGKDLRNVSRLIGSGGYLSRAEDFVYDGRTAERIGALHNGEQVSLLPRKIEYYRDVQYLFPLPGNLVEERAPRAVLTAINSIV